MLNELAYDGCAEAKADVSHMSKLQGIPLKLSCVTQFPKARIEAGRLVSVIQVKEDSCLDQGCGGKNQKKWKDVDQNVKISR